MAKPVYKLRIGAFQQELKTLGFTGAVITLGTQTPDVLDLTQAVATPDDEPWLTAGDYATILEDGAPIFTGRVVARTSARPNALRRPFRLLGGWSELTRRFYAQPWGNIEGANVLYGRVGLGYDGGLITTGAQIRKVLEWAIAHGAHLLIGSIDAGVKIAPDYVADRTCAEVVSRMLEYTPDHIPYFDYSTAPPTFHCKQASRTRVQNLSARSFADGLDCFRSFEGEINGLVMTVKTQTLQAEEDVAEGEEAKYETTWLTVKRPSGATLGEDGVLSFSFDEKDFEGLDPAAILAEQAEALLAAVDTFSWSGQGTLKGGRAPATPRPGVRVNVRGMEGAWESMRAVVYQSRRDLFAGTNALAWGPPRNLGLNDMVALVVRQRRRNTFTPALQEEQTTGQSDEQTYGFDGKEKKKKGEGGSSLPAYPVDAGDYAMKVTITEESSGVLGWEEIGDCDTP